MKKIADYIAASAFFIIIVMFAVYTIIMSGKDEKTTGSDVKNISENYVDANFPLTANWRSLRTTMLVATGRKDFEDTFIMKNRLVEVSDSYDKEQVTDSIAQINTFAEENSPQVFAMIAPTASGIYSAQLPIYAQTNDQRGMIDSIYYDLDEKIKTIDTFYPLYSAKNKSIYYRTDRKWTSFGAYYAYADGIKQMGFEPVALSNYDQEYASDSYYGELYSRLCYNRITADRVNIFRSKYQSTVKSVELYSKEQVLTSKSVYFRSALKTADKTAIYLQGDNFTKATVKTTLEDGPKLLIIKGSFANTILPFFTPHYSEITLVDPDKLAEEDKVLSDVVDTDDFDQVLFMYDCDQFCNEKNFDRLK